MITNALIAVRLGRSWEFFREGKSGTPQRVNISGLTAGPPMRMAGNRANRDSPDVA